MTDVDKTLIKKAIEARDRYEAAIVTDCFSRETDRLGRLYDNALRKLTPYYQTYVNYAFDLTAASMAQ